MAQYHYDEAGNMATYFLITFLVFILIPLTMSLSPSKKKMIPGCQCQACIDQRARIAKREGSIFNPKMSRKTIFVIFGWSLVAYLSYKVANAELENTVYDPFQILGIKMGTSEKEIKSHFKKLSKIYHPDKVRATVNETVEEISNRFVEITKAYKALTDETIRRNWEQYGHPDGRQEFSMGIAIPKHLVEGANRYYVLAFYGIVFGGVLPGMVLHAVTRVHSRRRELDWLGIFLDEGYADLKLELTWTRRSRWGRWWFGSRQKTKDGINAKSAAAFFKGLKEDSGVEDVVGVLGKAYKYEKPSTGAGKGKERKFMGSKEEVEELERLEEEIRTWGTDDSHIAQSTSEDSSAQGQLVKSDQPSTNDTANVEKPPQPSLSVVARQWNIVRKLVQGGEGYRALVLIYAHLLRLEVMVAGLREGELVLYPSGVCFSRYIPLGFVAFGVEQTRTLLLTPTLLNALLNISMSRNWLLPTMAVMRLHAYFVQALVPPSSVNQGTPGSGNDKQRLAQLPNIKVTEIETLAGAHGQGQVVKRDEGKGNKPELDIPDLIKTLEARNDGRVVDVKKAAERWGRLDVVEASGLLTSSSFLPVIDERIVTPSSIVFLVVKLRIVPPTQSSLKSTKERTPEEIKKSIRANEEKDNAFLLSRKDAEDIEVKEGEEQATAEGYAHAPYWPGNRKPSWWLVIADEKLGKVVVPPLRITSVPYTNSASNGASISAFSLLMLMLTLMLPTLPCSTTITSVSPHTTAHIIINAPAFNASFNFIANMPPLPPLPSLSLHLHLAPTPVYHQTATTVRTNSNSKPLKEVGMNMTLKVDDASALTTDEKASGEQEDEISDPEEDSLAGQMAAMRGGPVKKAPAGRTQEESDEESSTDDDDDSSDDSSDSDSD
ncbi:hypothetical protein D9758_008999 [Tetrapyrgos nigripes]|uniref:J domain-containing protein n=1 Tax=Tetrapyrgos nigripes TaxID=182062 RepID=A0A8H5LR68_9AGAR|nr:hypothetical protein D9758_008999 [Tetrapyrgos nigripes]